MILSRTPENEAITDPDRVTTAGLELERLSRTCQVKAYYLVSKGSLI